MTGYKFLLITWLILDFTTQSFSQKNDSNPLMLFFQNNYDSTIIYNATSSWHPEPSYSIVAKKLDRVYFFTYKSPYTWTSGRTFPGELIKKFMTEQSLYEATQPDTNRYFVPFEVNYDRRSDYWREITSYEIWQAKEVVEAPGGCDEEDGGTDTFYLITGKQIKTLSYYSPDFYETCRSTNIYRQTAIKTRKALEAAFSSCR